MSPSSITRPSVILIAFLLSVFATVKAFTHQATCHRRTTFLNQQSSEDDEAKALLERVARLRAEIAEAEGKTTAEVESEARTKKADEKERIAKAEKEREEAKQKPNMTTARRGRLLDVPSTAEEMMFQAARAVERAFADGITRQTVRFALVKEGEAVSDVSEQWPGGPQQMYREAARPLTEALLREVRAPTKGKEDEKGSESNFPPKVTSQDVWDFDGSGLVTATASSGPKDDVQALVFPNTDAKYTDDIEKIDQAMGQRLFLLINPFWSKIDTWGFNILAPNAKARAQEVIFDKGYNVTYALTRKSVRGENCVALKSYPYDWQMFAYVESEAWPYEEVVVRLGSSEEEPKSAMFLELLNQREEFKLSKNMRQLQRRIK